MVEVIKAEASEALAKRFRRRAIELYGYNKGSLTGLLNLRW
ncbi:MAG: hypothetical protein QXH24_06540 [Candidatus Bathyarchaeia archaeon]